MTARSLVGSMLRRLFSERMAERDLRKLYFSAHGRYPNIRKPKLFTEKIQHRKLYDKDQRFSLCADKVLVKDYVHGRLGADILIPTLYSGERLPPPAQRTWPLPFVIKTNHGSSFNIFVRQDSDLDWPAIEAKLAIYLAIDFGAYLKEWHYSKIVRQILIEPFLSEDGELPVDYKIFVFGGTPEYIQVDTDRESAHKRIFFDVGWKPQTFQFTYPLETKPIDRPSSLDTMLSAAAVLGRDFDFVRVDFYEIGGRPYFGEMTFTPEAGFGKFDPPEIDTLFGEMWTASRH